MERQLNNIIDFQNKAKGYKDNILPRIGASIGKDLEGYKVQIKSLEYDLERINEKIDKNSVDIFILEKGNSFLSRGKRAIEYIESNNYKKLIRRSMENYEICLVRVEENNLRCVENGNIEVGTINYLTYNLIEHDIYSYLKRIKRKTDLIDIEYTIEYFVSKSLLDDDSIKYLNGLLSYPLESLRIWNKYRKNKKNLTEEEYIDAFYKAIKIDGNELIAKGGCL